MSARRLAQLRACLPYTGGRAKIVLRQMIADLEAELSRSGAKPDSGETVPEQLSQRGDRPERRPTSPRGKTPDGAVLDPVPVRRDPSPSAGRKGEDSGQLQEMVTHHAPRFGDWLIKAFGELGTPAEHGDIAGVIIVDNRRMSHLVAQEYLEKLQRRRSREVAA